VYVNKNPPYRVSPAACDPKDRRRHTVPLLRLRPTSVLRSFGPRPHGRLKAHKAGDIEGAPCPSAASQFSSAISNALVPPLIGPYTYSPKNIPLTSFPSRRESICEYLVAENTYRIGRAGDPCVGGRILCFFKTLRTWLPDSSCSRGSQPLVPRSAPYRAKPGTATGLPAPTAWRQR
jgi:hypothetical protein